jgi:hypothetical protein
MSDNRRQAYSDWVTGLDTEPPLEGAFNAGWLARDAELERLRGQIHADRRLNELLEMKTAEWRFEMAHRKKAEAEVDQLRKEPGRGVVETQLARIQELRADVERHERQFRETEAEWVERFEALETEVERLRAAAQTVIDSINDENEIDPDAIFHLSQALVSDKEC